VLRPNLGTDNPRQVARVTPVGALKVADPDGAAAP
jgi:hypothetical protein